MVGLVGRSSILLDCRLGQYSRRWFQLGCHSGGNVVGVFFQHNPNIYHL